MNRRAPLPGDNSTPTRPPASRDDNTADLRIFAAWIGLALVIFGVTLSVYMFWRVGEVLLDPRSFETQVDRWEFVVRGRTNDALPIEYETPDRQRITLNGTAANPEDAAAGVASPQKNRAQETADMLGRIGSKSARPAALFVIIALLALLSRLAIGVVHAGIRLTYLTAGEKDYMKRIVEELREDKNRR